jgi:hypothetical protein
MVQPAGERMLSNALTAVAAEEIAAPLMPIGMQMEGIIGTCAV